MIRGSPRERQLNPRKSAGRREIPTVVRRRRSLCSPSHRRAIRITLRLYFDLGIKGESLALNFERYLDIGVRNP
jgi:hypothetical protein